MVTQTPEEARKLWCEALRSGEFKQATGYLSKRGEDGEWGHCCLGVACEVYKRAGGELLAESSSAADSGRLFDVMSYDGWNGSLPPKVQTWLGLNCGGRFDYPNTEAMPDGDAYDDWSAQHPTSLVDLNDCTKASFQQIADKIESVNWEEAARFDCEEDSVG